VYVLVCVPLADAGAAALVGAGALEGIVFRLAAAAELPAAAASAVTSGALTGRVVASCLIAAEAEATATPVNTVTGSQLAGKSTLGPAV